MWNNKFVEAALYRLDPDPQRIRAGSILMIRKLKSGKYRLYSKKKDPKTGKRKNLGTFDTREEALKHEKQVQYFKRR
jgi:hypothetical protein